MLANFARLMVIVAAFSLATTAAVADKGASGSWFNSLNEEERVQVQTDLVLLGFYNQFVDGVFGSETYGAITSYQRSVRADDTGVMTPAEVSTLNVAATRVRVEMGIDLVQDERGGSALLLPQLFLPIVTPMQDGTLYSPADNSASVLLQTVHQQMGELGLPELFSSLTAPAGGRSVTYSNLTDSRLVVTGQLYGRNFYEMHFSAGTDIVGYRVSWLDAYAPQGQMIATFTASHFLPMYFLEDAEQLEDAAVTPVAPDGYLLPDVESSERIGQFLLFRDNASVIALDGEFTSGSALEFVRVLKARPKAKLLILNSDGGLVDPALLIAHQVFERGMSTIILDGLRCHSACAFVYFAGHERGAFGELGVHQVWNEQNDAVATQVKLSDVLEALTEFEVPQPIISAMLRTPPDEMHIFSKSHVASFGINVGVPHRHLALAGKTAGKKVAAREASAREEAERRSAEQAEIEADIERRAAEAAAREAYEREGSERAPREDSSVPSPPNGSDVEGEVIWGFYESAGRVSCSVSIDTRELSVSFMYIRSQDQLSAILNTGAMERHPRMIPSGS